MPDSLRLEMVYVVGKSVVRSGDDGSRRLVCVALLVRSVRG